MEDKVVANPFLLGKIYPILLGPYYPGIKEISLTDYQDLLLIFWRYHVFVLPS